MEKTISGNKGSITFCEVTNPDHLGRVHLEIRMGDRYIYQRLEEVVETIKALKVKKKEMELKLGLCKKN
jgi:3-deoxy-D-arabino-heptulosonate 7-phosphate (DAHP) synthase class II